MTSSSCTVVHCKGCELQLPCRALDFRARSVEIVLPLTNCIQEGFMIEVVDLVKKYGDFTAVHGLTFSVPKGQILGLLGPNGAGKSTTMKILSCFMPATSGQAKVAGFDVFEEAEEVKKKVGYLP